MSRRYVLALALLLASFSSMGIGVASASPAQYPGRTAQTHRHHVVSASSWQQHDRAVYVVSTLNGPLCPGGKQLSTVLWQSDKARIFDVLKSTTDKNLYYIQVRRPTRAIIGVYAYTFGWKMPAAVSRGRCVADIVTPSVVNPYKFHQFKFIARFRTTFPQT